MNQELESAYLSEVTITDFPPFVGQNNVNFTRPDGGYQQWNVILGNNNTGKTTLLKLLSGLSFRERIFNEALDETDEEAHFETYLEASINFNFKQFLRNRLRVARWRIMTGVFDKIIYARDEFVLRESVSLGAAGIDSASAHYSSIFYAYGLSRRMSSSDITGSTQKENNITPLFQDDYELNNAEEWLIQLDYAAKNGATNAKRVLEKLITVLTNGLLPDVKSIELISEFDEKTNNVRNYALFDTDYGKVRLKDLGYGYQSMMAWVVDLAKKMFERYPKLDNPLTGAAIVLVDEIDLHLHPDWQRKIISHLSGIFPHTQFIVTAHSPLIVQSAENVNLIILEKGENNQTHIRQEFGTFRGWTVEEILQDLMGLGDRTLSDTYLKLLKDFDEGLDEDNYEKAQAAYDALLPLLHPQSSQRKLLKLQLGAIAPAAV